MDDREMNELDRKFIELINGNQDLGQGFDRAGASLDGFLDAINKAILDGESVEKTTFEVDGLGECENWPECQ